MNGLWKWFSLKDTGLDEANSLFLTLVKIFPIDGFHDNPEEPESPDT